MVNNNDVVNLTKDYVAESGGRISISRDKVVTINGNGHTIDANGIAKMNINLLPGDYIITAEYKDAMVANNIKVLPILNATDINMKYRDGTQLWLTVRANHTLVKVSHSTLTVCSTTGQLTVQVQQN